MNSSPAKITLFDEQKAAVESILEWFTNSSSKTYVLEGPAGTGKSFTLKALVEQIPGRILYTSPTNKATRVLRETLKTPEYTPDCRTIYSALGLSLSANGEIKELTVPEDPVDLSDFVLIVVDEFSMVNRILFKLINETAEMYNIKFLFVGDPYQLPPVKETHSPVTELKEKSSLQTVRRFDNAILRFVTDIREQIPKLVQNIKIVEDNDGQEGVWALSKSDFNLRMEQKAIEGEFSKPDGYRVIAWRNVTVDTYNQFIRNILFPGVTVPWVEGDRIILTAPANDINNEKIASTDDEGTVQSAQREFHSKYPEFSVYRLSVVLDTGRLIVLRVLNPDYQSQFDTRKERLAAEAKRDKRLWKDFWEFVEAFHSARHAYALTAHRSQGSTYEGVFVDWKDILINRQRKEAFQCLYVACSRPKKQLFLA